MKQYFGYIFFRILIFSYKLVPFPVLYAQSWFLYLLLYRVVGYKKKTVAKNLKNSFPDKSDAELNQITKKFYKHLADITLESIKGLSMNPKKIIKRYKVINPEFSDKYKQAGQSIIGVSAHYGNWEWGVLSFGYQFSHDCIGFYKPLKNKYIDRYIRKARAASGVRLVSIKETGKLFSETFDKPRLFIMISDQSPSNSVKAHWTDFLNQDTACLHGAEKYAKKYDYPVIYGNIIKKKRGFYEVELMPVSDRPRESAEGEITRKFMKILENIIQQEPAFWLWSHNRWKKTRRK